ncbi:DNA repair protein Rad60 [Hylaeus anthracinus]|uniref:DNA repair protein Rad60 n=1 Tax=Hylaeus anthracinus TaxID=313031 RepID=UPI0023B98DEB|nr:DNA repair protein Rad60 [Hylaeus anthracinus]
METVQLESSSEDDNDIYLNPVAKLKALKKQTSHFNKEKDQEKKDEKTEEIEVIEDTPTVETCRVVRRTRNNRKTCGPRTRKQRQTRAPSEHDSDLEIVSVEDKLNSLENDLIIVENNIHVNSSDDENYDIDIKILWRSKNVHRLKIRCNENFRKVFEYFANFEQVSTDEILITKNDKTIKKSDTPASINLSVIDILEGGIVTKGSNTLQNDMENKVDEDTRIIKVQTKSKKYLTISVMRDENFEALWAKCAQELNIEESKMKLYFDGELIAMTDTPDSLEIEDEACFDLQISS